MMLEILITVLCRGATKPTQPGQPPTPLVPVEDGLVGAESMVWYQQGTKPQLEYLQRS